MERTHTFDLKDMDEAFWKKIIFAQKVKPSGLGGPGHVWLVSEDGKKFSFGFEDTPFWKCEEIFPVFEEVEEAGSRRVKYKAEEQGWKYRKEEDALIREDIWEAYNRIMEEKKQVKKKFWMGLLSAPDVAGLALGVEQLERYDYIKSVLYVEKMEREMEKIHAQKKKRI